LERRRPFSTLSACFWVRPHHGQKRQRGATGQRQRPHFESSAALHGRTIFVLQRGQ
jgi:hypothetical protein